MYKFIIMFLVGYLYFYKIDLKNESIDDFTLCIGYKEGLFYKRDIIVNMLLTPHILVCGLTGNGKSKMIEYSLKNKNVILFNVFYDDFRTISARRINGIENIMCYLSNFYKNLSYRNRTTKPLYLIFDDVLILCIDKKISDLILKLLSVGRHYNVFIIAISQTGLKESLKFKDLFNTRICFKMIEESAYRAVLGYTPNDKLDKRQFYVYSHEFLKGSTHDI